MSVCSLSAVASAQAVDVVLEIDNSLASRGFFGTVNDIRDDLITNLGRFDTEEDCISAITSDSTEQRVVGILAENATTDATISCRVYSEVQDCEPDILTGNLCVAENDIGPRKRIILYAGDLEIDGQIFGQTIPDSHRMSDSEYQVLRTLIFGEFNGKLRSYLGTQRHFTPTFAFEFLGDTNFTCSEFIQTSEYQLLAKSALENDAISALMATCFSVTSSGQVKEISGKVFR